jgi:hypothetical protein
MRVGPQRSEKERTERREECERRIEALNNEKEKQWSEAFTNYLIEEWKKKGSLTDEEAAREEIDAILFLLSRYKLKYLIATLIEFDDMIEEFDESHPEYQGRE